MKYRAGLTDDLVGKCFGLLASERRETTEGIYPGPVLEKLCTAGGEGYNSTHKACRPSGDRQQTTSGLQTHFTVR